MNCPRCGTELVRDFQPVNCASYEIEYDVDSGLREIEVTCLCGYVFTGLLVEKTPEPEEVLTKRLFGVRGWAVGRDGELQGTGTMYAWGEGEQVAECHRFLGGALIGYPADASHESPARNCQCGLHAFYDLTSYQEYGDFADRGGDHIYGVVSAAGNVECHETGFRAERMRLEALILGRQTVRVYGQPVAVSAAQRRLAEQHGVPLILPGEVTSFAREKDLQVLAPDPAPKRHIYNESGGMLSAGNIRGGMLGHQWMPPLPPSGAWHTGSFGTPTPPDKPKSKKQTLADWAREIKDKYGF